jgi:thioredoxin 1
MLAPVIEELSEELKGQVGVAKLNTDENQGIAARFRISAIPTLLVFRDGVQQRPLVGLMPKEDIKAYLMGL